jgi:hypothetical protein
MSCILRFAVTGLWLYGKSPENPDIGSPKSGGECGIVHIGGAKTIQLDD